MARLLLVHLLYSAMLLHFCKATTCFVCSSLESNEDCNANAVLRNCRANEVCDSKISSFGKRYLIIKRCTPRENCIENCKGELCRTCCKSDKCNENFRARLPTTISSSVLGASNKGRSNRCNTRFSRGVVMRCVRLKAGIDGGATPCIFWCARRDYQLRGPARLNCIMGGDGAQWSGALPVCVPKHEAMTNPPACNAIDYDSKLLEMDCTDGFQYKSSCSFRCKEGYYLIHPTTYRPLMSSKTVCWKGVAQPTVWTESPPRCVSKKCPIIVRQGISMVRCTNWIRAGSVCNFECLPGYLRVGPETLKCLDLDPEGLDAGWNVTTPTCEPRECQSLDLSPNTASIQCTDDIFFKSECTFKCAPGYYLTKSGETEPLPQNERTSKCRVSSKGDMVWKPSPPVCIRKKCPDIPTMDHGHVRCTNANNYMSTCSFSCEDAFMLIGVETLECIEGIAGNTKHGIWDGTIPWCKPKICDPPIYNTKNMGISCSNDYFYNSECTFNCLVGYYMTKSDGETFVPTGKTNSHCSISAERMMIWSDDSPICHLKTCEVLSNPDNGFVSCTDFNNHGSRCFFDCLPGHTLNGPETLTCEESGSPSQQQIWNHDIPTCEARSCPRISYDDSTTAISCTDGILFGSICTFVCKEGHYMPSLEEDQVLGNSLSACVLNDLDELIWSGSSPQCSVKTCTALSDPARGKVQCTDGVNFESVCTFSCDIGYEPDGRNRLMCSDDSYNSRVGVWDKTPPSCIRRSCPSFNVDLTSTGFVCDNELKYESECNFTCMQGHYMTKRSNVIDHAKTVCETKGINMVWSEAPPLCEIKACPELRNPDGGSLKCSNEFLFGSVCTAICSPGYSLEGHKIVQCEDNGVNDPNGIWSYQVGECQRRSCPNRNDMVPLIMSQRCSNDHLFESICTYTCDEGYYMEKGSVIADSNLMEVECQVKGEDMRWSSALPACKTKVCSMTGMMPEDGDSLCAESVAYGSMCEFSCRIGFDLEGTSRATCESSGENIPTGVWNSDPPVCERRFCAAMAFNATLVQMQCSDGNKFESKCSFSCANGFYAIDDVTGNFIRNPNTTCSADSGNVMYWTYNPPVCIKKTCFAFPPFEHGTISCTDEYHFESTCTFECWPGFSVIGEQMASCIDNGAGNIQGEWSSLMPTCQRRACAALTYSEDDTNVNCTISNFFESVCQFNCKYGYYMTSSSNNIIMDYADTACDVNEDGMFWTNPSPNCRIKTCPNPRTPEEGIVDCDDANIFGSNCNFSCAPHRQLSGVQTLRCEADSRNIQEGHWSYEFPTCELRSCMDLNIEKRAIIEECTNAYKYGSNCSFSCNIGHYVPEENMTFADEMTYAQCGIQGSDMTWYGEPPNCKIKKCTTLTAPVHGRLQCSEGFNWDTMCEFHCDRGFLLVGKKELRCKDDDLDAPYGIWDGVEPVCEARSCEALSYDVETQKTNCDFGNKYSSVCNLRCQVGYYMTARNGIDLTDNATAVCDVNPQNHLEVAWIHDEPKCFIKTCIRPTAPADGIVTCKDGLTHGKRCVYECQPGFKMIGQPTTGCQDDGKNKPLGIWGRDAPVCEPKSCAKLLYNSNTTNFACTNGWKYRSVCTFSCNKGYFVTEADLRTIVTSGSKETKCDRGVGDGMAWTDDVPVCLSKFCFAIRPKRNMTVECSDKFRFNSRCSIKCDPPLRLVGSPVLTCLDDERSPYSGKWSGSHWQLRCTR